MLTELPPPAHAASAPIELRAPARARVWPSSPRDRRLALVEFARYFLSSLLALGVDAGGLYLLVEKAGWHYLPAAALCFLAGSLVAFLLSALWAFEAHSFRRWHDGFVVFTLIGLVGLGVNLGILWLGVGALGLPYMLAKGGAALGSFSLNFVLRKLALFSSPAKIPA